MRNDKEMKSGDTDPISSESRSAAFFMKYSPADEQGAGPDAPRFFTRYLPPRVTTEIDNKELTEAPECETVLAIIRAEQTSTSTRWPNVWPVLVIVALVPLTIGIWQGVRSRNTHNKPPIADSFSLPSNPVSQISIGADNRAGPEILSLANPPSEPGLTKSERRSNSTESQSSTGLPGLDAMLSLAREYEDRGMPERAVQQYNAILARFPDHQASLAGLNRVQSIISSQGAAETARQNRETGLKKFRAGDYSPAAMYLSASVEGGCSDTATLYSLGMSYLKLGRPSEAGKVLDRCIAARPDYAPALVGLAEVERDRGSIERAVSLLRRARELGGGAEFTPFRITEMISALEPETKTTTIEPKPVLVVTAVHQHAFSRCRGQLTIGDSEIIFNSDKPSHNFRISGDAIKNVRASGSQLNLLVAGKPWTLTLEGGSAVDFLKTMGH